jgi:two-component system alkaline phosphatase synthesis response regulator PhoP
MAARVLLVEDHPTMREAVRMVLASEGYVVTEASDGVAALAEVARARPDVMVLDLHMPVLDGAAVLGRLRADPLTADLPVIVVTADGEEGRMVARRLGADEYVTKPFDPAALLRMIARVLARAGPPAT